MVESFKQIRKERRGNKGPPRITIVSIGRIYNMRHEQLVEFLFYNMSVDEIRGTDFKNKSEDALRRIALDALHKIELGVMDPIDAAASHEEVSRRRGGKGC